MELLTAMSRTPDKSRGGFELDLTRPSESVRAFFRGGLDLEVLLVRVK